MNRLGLLWLLALGSLASHAELRISEFMASNGHTLEDEDHSFPDWIEIQNTGPGTIDLSRFCLTDSAADPTKWTFPATNLSSGGFLVVFASGKDRRVPGLPLHTNFRLGSSGEYLALVQIDGQKVINEFNPYPPQFPDVSYGISTRVNLITLVATNAPVRFLVPASDSAGTNWISALFDDSSWSNEVNALGYETLINDPLEDSYAAQVQQLAPVTYWRLDETNGTAAVNAGSLGASANGTYSGGITLGLAGPRPPAFNNFEPDNLATEFDGTDSYVAGPMGLVNGFNQFTFAGWIRPITFQNNRTGLFGQNDAIEFGFIDGATLQAWSPANSLNVTYPFNIGEWHHIAVVGSSSALELFLDGQLAGASGGQVSSYGSSDFAFNIGGGGVFDSSGNFFAGDIDEVAVWDRALSTNEVSQLVSGSSQIDFRPYLATDVRDLMYDVNASSYLRIPFTLKDAAGISQLTLRMRYDDGFVAWINGRQVALRNAPDLLSWDSSATARHPDEAAIRFETFDLSDEIGFLTSGTNLLAIQALNINATNRDLLVQAELIAAQPLGDSGSYRYFTQPSPGGPNGLGTADLGPLVLSLGHTPSSLDATGTLAVTALVAQASSTISNVTLNYRVMFGPEITLSMIDNGTNSVGGGGASLWTASIVPTNLAAGQMLRYYITAVDNQGNSTRWPLFTDSTASEQYYGTVMEDPSIQTRLPLVDLFVENPGSLDGGIPVRASLRFLDEFYDNISIDVHGQSSSGWPKKSFNIGFTADHPFLYHHGKPREKNIRLLSPYGDKARMRTTLTYTEVAAAGAVGHFSFAVRVQRNGAFYGLEDMLEDGDDHWLSRLGRDPNGALYKMYNGMGSAGGNEKKTRKNEDFSDLQNLIDNLDESTALSTRVRYAYDNLDLPQTVSYFATMALVSSQDHGHKNFYLYRDSDRTGEWTIFPWDVDLTWGRNWLDSQGYFTDTLFETNVLNFYDPSQQGKEANRLYDLMFNHPDFRHMYLRRLRTLMDTILMPNGTPTNALPIEAHIREFTDLMEPLGMTNSDAALDRAKWGPDWGNRTYADLRIEAGRIMSIHLPGRRDFLFNSPRATLLSERIPSAQPSDATITVASLDYLPLSGNQDQEYVELANTNSFAVDVSGWYLGGTVLYTFKPGTVILAGRSLFVSPDVNAFRARSTGPSGGQSIFVQGNYSNRLGPGAGSVMVQDGAGRLVATAAYGPKAPQLKAALGIDSHSVIISFQAAANQTYTVQWQDLAGPGTWIKLTDVPSLASDHSLALTNMPSPSGALFRVLTPAQP